MAVSSDFRGRVAEGAVGRYLILKPGTAANSCLVAAAATDKLLGTGDELAHVTGEMVDLNVSPIGKVVLGGTVAAGDALTSNASGQAIVTTTTGNRIIGYAEIPGVAGDEITYLRALGVL
jgi:hypothetical protein